MRILLVAIALLLLSAVAAKAQTCTTTITDVNFGSPDLASGAVDTTATLTVSCSGLTGSSKINVCPSFNAGSGGVSGTSRTMTGPSSATLLYNLFTDSARTTRWGSLTDTSLGTVPLIPVVKTSSTGAATATVYGRIPAGQASVQPGAYSSSFAGHVSVKYTGDNDCSTGGTLFTTTPSFTVLASPVASCTVSADALSFGARGVIDALVDASSNLSVTCANGLAYSIGLNNGQTGASAITRKMVLSGESVTYGLYQDASRALPWGEGSFAVSGTGSGAAQAYTVYGRVPAQPTPSPGAYTDVVVATVVY